LGEIASRIGRRLRRLLRGAAAEQQLEVGSLADDELERIRAHFPRAKFFISGYPRSGTTLLARLIRLHPAVECRWQAHFASDELDLLGALPSTGLQSWLDRPSNRWVGQADLMPALVRLTADYVLERDLPESVRVVGDKTPVARLDLALDRLARFYPDASLILIVRDGRDAVLSQRIQAFLDQPQTLGLGDLRVRDQFLGAPAAFGGEGRSIFDPAWLVRVAGAWNRAVTLGQDRAESTYGVRCLTIRYEDLLSDAWGVCVRLWGFLEAGELAPGLRGDVEAAMQRNPAADWHAQLAPAVAERLQRGAAGGWRDWLSVADRHLFETNASPGLERWDYQ
jgi:hypothetical protein